MRWIKEVNPVWDDSKERIINDDNNDGCFNICNVISGDKLKESIWFRLVDDSEKILGYGWIYGDEISIAVDKQYIQMGYGSIIINNLNNEMKQMGFKEITAIIQTNNPNRESVIKWAYKNGFFAKWPGLQGIEQLTCEKACNLIKKINIDLSKPIV